jgi:hypothetical protein
VVKNLKGELVNKDPQALAPVVKGLNVATTVILPGEMPVGWRCICKPDGKVMKFPMGEVGYTQVRKIPPQQGVEPKKDMVN